MSWRDMTHEERLAFIRKGFSQGRSMAGMGEEVGVTEGVIRYFRDRHAPKLCSKAVRKQRAINAEKVDPEADLNRAKARAEKADKLFDALMRQHYPGKRYGLGTVRVAA